MLQLLRARALQPKLSVSHPADVYEQEADRVADQVMRMPESVPSVPSVPDVHMTSITGVQRCSACEEDPQHRATCCGADLQRASTSSSEAPVVDAAFENSVSVLPGRGQPLPSTVRSFMEPRFGIDFSAVRIHTDAHAHTLARAVQAQAFTVGHDIVFGAGYYAPQTEGGKRLIAHELTHTVQQRGIARQVARTPTSLDLSCEFDDPDRMSAREWLACNTPPRMLRDTGHILRNSATGEPVGPDDLFKWAIAHNLSTRDLCANIEGRAFSGDVKVRREAAQFMRAVLEEMGYDDLRNAVLHERWLQAQRDRRWRWIMGEGEIEDDTERATPRDTPYRTSSGVVRFETFDDLGELATLDVANSDELVKNIRQQLENVVKKSAEITGDIVFLMKADRKNVEETRKHAQLLERIGLALPGIEMGFSKHALEHGVVAGKAADRAAQIARAALKRLDKEQEAFPGKYLNEARYELMRAKHSKNRMLRVRDNDDLRSVSIAGKYSLAGDYATMLLPPVMQVGMSMTKSVAKRVARMDHDPKAEFGWGDFAKETALNYFSMRFQAILAGENPGFLRAFGANVISAQTTNALAAGSASKLFELDAEQMVFAVAGAAHSGWRSRSAGMGPLTPMEPFTPAKDVPAPATHQPPAATESAQSHHTAGASKTEHPPLIELPKGHTGSAERAANVATSSWSDDTPTPRQLRDELDEVKAHPERMRNVNGHAQQNVGKHVWAEEGGVWCRHSSVVCVVPRGGSSGGRLFDPQGRVTDDGVKFARAHFGLDDLSDAQIRERLGPGSAISHEKAFMLATSGAVDVKTAMNPPTRQPPPSIPSSKRSAPVASSRPKGPGSLTPALAPRSMRPATLGEIETHGAGLHLASEGGVPAILYMARSGRVRVITVVNGKPHYRSLGESVALDGSKKEPGQFYELAGIQQEAHPPEAIAAIRERSPEPDRVIRSTGRGWLIKGGFWQPALTDIHHPVPELLSLTYTIEGVTGVPEQVNAWLVDHGAVPYVDFWRHYEGFGFDPDPDPSPPTSSTPPPSPRSPPNPTSTGSPTPTASSPTPTRTPSPTPPATPSRPQPQQEQQQQSRIPPRSDPKPKVVVTEGDKLMVKSRMDSLIGQGMEPTAAKRKAIEEWFELRPDLPNVELVRNWFGREFGVPPVKYLPPKVRQR